MAERRQRGGSDPDESGGALDAGAGMCSQVRVRCSGRSSSRMGRHCFRVGEMTVWGEAARPYKEGSFGQLYPRKGGGGELSSRVSRRKGELINGKFREMRDQKWGCTIVDVG